jgi:large subunit ribosomal protein L31
MKKDIHPKYYTDAKVSCSCGSVFSMGSTQKEIKVEICSACHPFFTGNEKVMDTAGRVEKFKARKAASTKVSKKKL